MVFGLHEYMYDYPLFSLRLLTYVNKTLKDPSSILRESPTIIPFPRDRDESKY